MLKFTGLLGFVRRHSKYKAASPSWWQSASDNKRLGSLPFFDQFSQVSFNITAGWYLHRDILMLGLVPKMSAIWPQRGKMVPGLWQRYALEETLLAFDEQSGKHTVLLQSKNVYGNTSLQAWRSKFTVLKWWSRELQPQSFFGFVVEINPDRPLNLTTRYFSSRS